MKRALNDHGSFDRHRDETTWRFHKRSAPAVSVEASAKLYVDAREIAARELARRAGVDVAPQDCVGLLVNDETQKAADDAEQDHQKPNGAARPID